MLHWNNVRADDAAAQGDVSRRRRSVMSRARLGPRSILFCVCALTVACADSAPAKITFTAPPPLIVSGKIIRLNGALANKKGEPIGGQAGTCSAAPADVVEVLAAGALRCLKTGDATLTLAGGGLSSPLVVKCRIPTEIAMPQELQLVLGSAPA